MRLAMSKALRATSRRLAATSLALGLTLGGLFFAGCSNSDVPITQAGSTCSSDDDCDPGDDCINGSCQGDSAGQDGGDGSQDGGVGSGDAGLLDDAGSGQLDGGGGADAGAPDGGEPDDGGPLDGGADAGSGEHDGGIDAGSGGHDGGTDAGSGGSDGGTDAGSGEPDGGVNDGGTIGPTGGTVDLLDFVLTGDTRPATCGSTATYPSAIFAQVIQSMASVQPQFGLDLGDHMYVCSQDTAAAKAQMALYVAGLGGFKAPFFMTMGNHECEDGADCSATPTDANYSAYLAALKSVSHETLPYYVLKIGTRLGRASFVFIADDFFDSTAQTWLQDTLTDADNNSAYTFVIKHHPVTGSRMGPTGPLTVLQSHQYSLILTAHDHDYAHNTSELNGRSVICGLGGANPNNTGFCRVQQQANGALIFTEYDISANPLATWAVTAR